MVTPGHWKELLNLLFFKKEKADEMLKDRKVYLISIALVAIGGLALILSFLDDPKGFKELVNLATTISFLIAPFHSDHQF